MNNEPVAFVSKEDLKNMKTHLCYLHLKPQKNHIPLYTHPVINNGGNLEELNTKVQDASTSLESTPPINAKPVGRYYWESVVDGHFMAVPSEGTIHYEIDDFPLYLHPVKELTDEEIYRLLADSIWAVGLNTDCLDEQNWADGITVAKAILRKAQEK